MSFVTTLGQFAIIPNLSAYLQHNLGYPRDRLGMVYMVGGAASFLAMRFTGSLVDRYGATRLIVSGTLLHAFVLGVGFIHPTAIVPALGVFVLFILSGSVRMVSISSLATRVPRPEQRAGFMAALTTVQHAGSSFGAMGSAALLAAEPSGRLIGMPAVAGIALSLALVVPFLAARLETSIRTREGLRTAHMALAKPAHSPAPMSAGGSELER